MSDPSRIGPFDIEGMLGRGGFGTVYRARDAAGRLFALKWMTGIDAHDPEQRLRFQREVEIASSVQHPNLVCIRSWDEWEGFPYSVMDLVEGPPLSEVIRTRPAGPLTSDWQAQVAALGTPLFAAIQHLHNHGIVHRDVKPENVFIAGDKTPMLGDFGLALREAPDIKRTRQGTLTGTIPYMAPELITGRDADRRSDMFALGVLLLELICGRLPYSGGDTGSILSALLEQGPMPLRELLPTAPPELDSVLARLTAYQPEDRYFTVAEACYDWMAALERWTGVRPAVAVPEVTGVVLMPPGFIGREDVLATLQQGRPWTVVEGEHGVGRSALVAHWGRSLPQAPWLVAFRDPDAIPLSPWIPLVEEVLSTVPPEPALAAVTQLVQAFRHGHSAPGPREHGFRVLEGSGEQGRLRLHEAIAELLERKRPIVLVVEDVHRADLESRRLLDFLAQRWPGGGDQVVVTSLTGTLPGPTMALASLTPPEQTAMVSHLLGVGDKPLPPALLAALADDAAGNPAAMQAVLGAYLQGQVLTLQQGQWTWHEAAYRTWQTALDADTSSVLTAVFRHAFASVSTAARDLLAVLAVGDVPTPLSDLARLLSASPKAVWELICAGKEAGLLLEDRSAQTSTWRVSRPVAALALEGRDVGHLHRAWAALLEDSPLENDRVKRLVRHRTAVGELLPVARQLLRLAETSAAGGGHDEACAMCRQVLDIPGIESVLSPDELRQLTFRRAEMARLAGRFGDAVSILQGMTPHSDPAEQARITELLALCAFSAGDYATAVESWQAQLVCLGLTLPGSGVGGLLRAVESTVRAQRPGWEAEPLRRPDNANAVVSACYGLLKTEYIIDLDPTHRNLMLYLITTAMQVAHVTQRDGLLGIAHSMATVLYTVYFHDEARRRYHRENAVAHAMRAEFPTLQVETLFTVSYFDILGGDLATGLQLARRSVDIARHHREVSGLCYSLNVVAMASLFSAEFDSLEAVLQEGLAVAIRIRDPRLALSFRTQRLWFEAMRGRLAVAYSYVHPFDFERYFPFDSAVEQLAIGTMMVLQGHLAPAEALLEVAGAEFERLRSGLLWQVYAAFMLGQCLSAMLATSAPRSRLVRLRRLARVTRRLAAGRADLLAMALPIRAEWLRHRGRAAEAERLYREAIELGHRSNMHVIANYLEEHCLKPGGVAAGSV